MLQSPVPIHSEHHIIRVDGHAWRQNIKCVHGAKTDEWTKIKNILLFQNTKHRQKTPKQVSDFAITKFDMKAKQ